MADKIREKYFFYLYVLTLFFGVLLCNITGLKATDEIFGLLLLLLYGIFIFTTKSKKFNAGVFITFSIFIFYFCYSIYVAYNTRHAIVLDFLIQIRPYLAFFIVSQISPTFSDTQKVLLKRLCFIMWLFFIPIGIYGFVNPSFLYSTFGQMSNYTANISCLALVYLFCSNFSIRERFTFILILSTGLLASNTEFYSIFLLTCGIILYFHHPDVFKFNIRTGIAITVVMLIVLHITRMQITEYIFPTSNITSEYVAVNQPTLYQTSVNILKDFFPLGSGLASFGTYAAGLYSPELYSQYGLTPTEGLTSPEYSSLSDSYYPSLAQFGIIGIALYLFFWIFVVSKSLIHFKQKGDIKQFVLVLILVSFVFIENISDSFFTSNKGYFMMMFLGVLFGKKKKYVHFSDDDKNTATNPVQTSLLVDNGEDTEDTLVVENIIDESNESSARPATEEIFHMPPIPIREEDLLEKEILKYSSQPIEKESIDEIKAEETQDIEVTTPPSSEELAVEKTEREEEEEYEEDEDEYEYDEDEDEDFEEEDEEEKKDDKIEDVLIIETAPTADTTDNDAEEIDNINEPTNLNIKYEILSDIENALQHTEKATDTVEHPVKDSIDLINENNNTDTSVITPDAEPIDKNELPLMDDELQSFDSLVDDDEEDILNLLSLTPDKKVDAEDVPSAEALSDHTENKLTEEPSIGLNTQYPEEVIVDTNTIDVPEQHTTSTLQPADVEKMPDINTIDNSLLDVEQHIELTITDSLVDDDDDITDIPEQQLEQSPEVSNHPENIDTPISSEIIDLTNKNAEENTVKEIELETNLISAQNIIQETAVPKASSSEPVTEIERPLSADQQDVNTASALQPVDVEKITDIHTDEISSDIEQHIELTIADSLVDDDIADIPEQKLEQSPEVSNHPENIDTPTNNNMASPSNEKIERLIVEDTRPNTTIASTQNTVEEVTFKMPPIPTPTSKTDDLQTKQEAYSSGIEDIKEETGSSSIENSTIPQKEKLPIINNTPETTTAATHIPVENSQYHIEKAPPQEVSNKPIERTDQKSSNDNTITDNNRVVILENEISMQEKHIQTSQPIIRREEDMPQKLSDELLTIAIGAELAQVKPESDLVKEYREIVNEYQFPEEKSEEIIVETASISTDTQNYTKYLDELLNESKTNIIEDDEESEDEEQIDYII